MIAAWIFLAVSLSSLVVQLNALIRLLRAPTQGTTVTIAAAGLRRACLCRVVAAVLYVALGLIALTEPAGPASGLFALLVFTFTQLLWQGNAIADLRLRRRMAGGTKPRGHAVKLNMVDLLERVGWTFVQALAGSVAAAGTAASLNTFDWRAALAGGAVAAGLSLLKVLGVSASVARELATVATDAAPALEAMQAMSTSAPTANLTYLPSLDAPPSASDRGQHAAPTGELPQVRDPGSVSAGQ